MAHTIQVFIAKTEVLAGIPNQLPAAHLVPLSQGFSMIPNTDELFDLTSNLTCAESAVSFKVFYKISPQLTHLAKQLSLAGPIAYIETEYFGGTGSQSAVVWENGTIILGPCTSETVYTADDGAQEPLAHGSINRALRCLGVLRETAIDEFDAVGLGRFRSNEGWILQPHLIRGKR